MHKNVKNKKEDKENTQENPAKFEHNFDKTE